MGKFFCTEMIHDKFAIALRSTSRPDFRVCTLHHSFLICFAIVDRLLGFLDESHTREENDDHPEHIYDVSEWVYDE